MTLERRRLAGLASLQQLSELARSARIEQPAGGLWEAADFQWWWRKPRRSDDLEQDFWFDEGGGCVAAGIVTDWDDRLQLDLVTTSSVAQDARAAAWHDAYRRALDVAADVPVEALLRDDDAELIDLATASGMHSTEHCDATGWLAIERRPPVPTLGAGYRLSDRSVRAGERHHMIERNGPAVDERLRRTALYRPDLDLCVLDNADAVAAYGLFWFDPATAVGLVEPMRTEAEHQGRGLARHVLTTGIGRLADLGATRVKISWELDNPASAHLYQSCGFEQSNVSTTWTTRP